MTKEPPSKSGEISNNIVITKAELSDINAIENLYHEATDFLNEQGIKQWNKQIYPTRQSAIDAQKTGNLYYFLMEDNLVGTFIINEEQAVQYKNLNWKYNQGKILVLHTLITKPSAAGRGVAKQMMQYIIAQAEDNGYGSIRLDVFPDNQPAVKLYLSFGFEFVGKVFFEFKQAGHEWYDCYEKLTALPKL